MSAHQDTSASARIINAYSPDDRDWAEQFHAALILANASEEQCARELSTQLETIQASGQGAEELLGSGWLFGKQRVREIKSPEQLALDELPVDSFRTLVQGFGLLMGAMALGFGLWIAIRDGWMHQSWLYWQLACFIAGGSIALIGTGFVYLRMASRFSHAWRLLLIGLPVTAFVVAPILMVAGEDEVIPMWNFVAPLLGLVLAVGVFFLPETGNASAAKGGNAAEYRDPLQWFAQARRILRGRYGFSRREADSALADAKGDWQAAEAAGQSMGITSELGTPNEFSIQLAPTNTAAMRRRRIMVNGAFIVLFGFYLVGRVELLLTDGFSWWDTGLGILCLLLIVYYATRLLPSKLDAQVQEKQLVLQQSADAVASMQDNI
ncbi:hypothetical protein AUR04nite_01830 [Glutamicibacter uratoxydans]|uniref:Uncharacterized protein n=1 Tax=Glutamicibacter uratoxydans TaxID=43667 RepID=A0A4Y4DQ17_GLUUR|nr:hypothetical protein [Glutamicibacter uratoxydans]GED04651.1 hypothetical protein AUR04nite_01830 [Glutamicibacter uratoxydans]